MKRYKILNIIFNIVAICLFVAAIITFSSEGDTAVGTLFLTSGFLFLISANLFLRKQQENSEKPQTPPEEPDEEELFVEELSEEALPEKITVHAEVVDMACGAEMVHQKGQGYFLPESVRYFLIKFMTDEGEVLEFSVEEEIYLSFDKGLRGTLTYFDQQIFSFEPDEE